MWISAMERIRKMLKETEARHVGNIVLVDKHANPVSFVTILYWNWINVFANCDVDCH